MDRQVPPAAAPLLPQQADRPASPACVCLHSMLLHFAITPERLLPDLFSLPPPALPAWLRRCCVVWTTLPAAAAIRGSRWR